MALTAADVARMSPSAQQQILAKLAAPLPNKGAPGRNQRSVSAGERTSGEKNETGCLRLGELICSPRGRKYHNEVDTRGEIKFASKKEARRYDELMLELRAGTIKDLRLQAQFTLQESYLTTEGDRVQAIRYVADFAYARKTAPDQNGIAYWLPVVEDVKSTATRTKSYLMKRKMFRKLMGYDITEV